MLLFDVLLGAEGRGSNIELVVPCSRKLWFTPENLGFHGIGLLEYWEQNFNICNKVMITDIKRVGATINRKLGNKNKNWNHLSQPWSLLSAVVFWHFEPRLTKTGPRGTSDLYLNETAGGSCSVLSWAWFGIAIVYT